MADRPAINQDARHWGKQIGGDGQAGLDQIDLRAGCAEDILKGGGLEPHAPEHETTLNQLPGPGGKDNPPAGIDTLRRGCRWGDIR